MALRGTAWLYFEIRCGRVLTLWLNPSKLTQIGLPCEYGVMSIHLNIGEVGFLVQIWPWPQAWERPRIRFIQEMVMNLRRLQQIVATMVAYGCIWRPQPHITISQRVVLRMSSKRTCCCLVRHSRQTCVICPRTLHNVLLKFLLNAQDVTATIFNIFLIN